MSWFEDWFNSPYYDMLYRNRNEAEAKAFINILIEHLKPSPNSKVADIPCGKGRYSKYLSGFDLDVYGFDLLENNITEASRYANGRLHFAKHDMRQPFYINYFDLIFNFFTSLGYFDNDVSDVRVLKNFHAALKPGGKLVIDFFNTEYVIQNLRAFSTIDDEGTLFALNKEFDGTSIIKNIEVQDKGKTYNYVEKVRAYTINDFEKMLAESDLKLVETFGDYSLNKFDKQSSPRLIIIAEKTHPLIEAIQHIDEKILYFINNRLASSFSDAVFIFCREKTNWIPLYIIMLLVIIRRYGRDSALLILFIIIIIVLSDQLTSSVLKPLVHRLRPCNNEEVKQHLRMVIAAGGGFSFVSSHAANHFALAFFYPQLFPKQKRWLMVVMMLWAAVISLSQVYVGYHYPSDVICGAILGLLCSGLVYYFARNKIKNIQAKYN